MFSRGSFFKGFKVLMGVWGKAASLAFPQHQAQALHGLMVSQMQGVKFLGQALNGLAHAFGLINGALFLDAQMHGEMQKRILFACIGGVALVDRFLFVM